MACDQLLSAARRLPSSSSVAVVLAVAPRLPAPPRLPLSPPMESNKEQMRSSDYSADRCSCCAISSSMRFHVVATPTSRFFAIQIGGFKFIYVFAQQFFRYIIKTGKVSHKSHSCIFSSPGAKLAKAPFIFAI